MSCTTYFRRDLHTRGDGHAGDGVGVEGEAALGAAGEDAQGSLDVAVGLALFGEEAGHAVLRQGRDEVAEAGRRYRLDVNEILVLEGGHFVGVDQLHDEQGDGVLLSVDFPVEEHQAGVEVAAQGYVGADVGGCNFLVVRHKEIGGLHGVDGVVGGGPFVVAHTAVALGDDHVVVFVAPCVVAEGEVGQDEVERGAGKGYRREAVDGWVERHVGLCVHRLTGGLDADFQTVVFLQGVVEEVFAVRDGVHRDGLAVDKEAHADVGDGLVEVVVEEEACVGEVHEGLAAGGGHGVEHQLPVGGLLDGEHFLAGGEKGE